MWRTPEVGSVSTLDVIKLRGNLLEGFGCASK
jgi:hypothetical protein